MKIIIKYTAKPQHKDALEKELRSIIGITRKAYGCVQCDLHTSVDNRLVFFFDQLWENEDRWMQYQERKHMQEFTTHTEAMIDTLDTCISKY
jgi:quinol monooxygenase YgiN